MIVRQWNLPLNGKGIMNSISRMNIFDLPWYAELAPITIWVKMDKTVAQACLQTSVEYHLYFDVGP